MATQIFIVKSSSAVLCRAKLEEADQCDGGWLVVSLFVVALNSSHGMHIEQDRWSRTPETYYPNLDMCVLL